MIKGRICVLNRISHIPLTRGFATCLKINDILRTGENVGIASRQAEGDQRTRHRSESSETTHRLPLNETLSTALRIVSALFAKNTSKVGMNAIPISGIQFAESSETGGIKKKGEICTRRIVAQNNSFVRYGSLSRNVMPLKSQHGWFILIDVTKNHFSKICEPFANF